MEEKRMYHVKIKNEVKEYEAAITYHDIAKEYQKDYEHEIVLVFVDGKLQELHKRLKKDCEISFVTTADPIGHEAYKRSMSFLLVKAVYDVAGHKNIDKVRMHFAIGPGYYCTITGETRVDDDFLERVESRMHELVEADLSIKKRTVHTDEAIGLFGQYGMYDKEELFRYRRVSKVNLYSINEFEDYYYGYMLYSTGYLKYFKLYRYDEGFVLQMPEIDKPETVPHFEARTKFFQVMKESVKWGDIQEIETVGGLNRNITSGDVQETVLVQEAMQERRIAEIAQMIASRPEIRFVLIAGPSSSGKTTFSHRLSVQLRANGMRPHPIAVDNYFKEREETPKDEKGNYNFEGLCAVLVENPSYCKAAGMHLKDEEFIRGKVPMTKSEVRSVSIAELELTEDAIVYDIGAGTGSVSIEIARAGEQIRVYAIEKNPEGVELIDQNRKKFKTDGVRIIEGLAPHAMEDLEAPTHAFIGGSSGNLREIVRLLQKKNPDVRIVINAISLETVSEVMGLVEEGILPDAEILQVSAAKSKVLGRYHMMMGQNPVYIISAGRRKPGQV